MCRQLVDDAANETTNNTRENKDDQEEKGKAYASPTSSLFSNYVVQPISKL